ncbi:MAG: GNAT family N-acetyltransferase [Clostridia bacterium]|nr:GNAT family N-acetyltransferase [Clostridia bacterium]
MILPANHRHREQIIELWNGAFGDRTEDVKKYLDTILKYFLVYEEDGIIKGMLSVLPVYFCNKRGGYVYAVTTHKDHRGQGICNKLMEYVKADKTYDFLVLKPQNDGLFEFYGKMGFEKVSCLSKKELYVEEPEKNYKLTTLSAQEYEMARNAYFGEEIIRWDSNMLSFAKDMYKGEFYAVEKDQKNVGFAFLYKEKNVAVIKELLAKENRCVANLVAIESGCQKAEITYKDQNGDEGFMIYPKYIKNDYFNIYFD